MQKTPDKVLVDKLKSNDKRKISDALNEIYRNNYHSVEQLIIGNGGTKDDVKDIFQESISIFFNQLNQKDLELNCSIKTYLYSVSRNQWLNIIRRKKETNDLKDYQEFVDPTQSSLGNIIENEQAGLIADLLQQISKDCKEILVNYYYYKMKMKKIQEVMALSSEQVAKNKKYKCLQRLRKMVDAHPHIKQRLN